ncbi:MAG TPA: polysaccharide biosynthesis tyrosine autokinase [Actinomycetota bacterium]|nr:polysaccharide biosynthesis tyrosine autokinase [Actinomycetota bacterium]
MDPVEYIRAVRRRWVLVALAVGVAITLAWVTTSVAPVGIGPPIRTYQATTVLLSTGGNAVGNLKTLAAIVDIPDISKRVADDLHYTQGDPAALGSQITAIGDTEAGLLKITATATDPGFARGLADKFSAELLAFLRDRVQSTNEAEASAINKQLNRLKDQISRLDERTSRTRSGTEFELLTAQRNAKVQTYGLLANQAQQLASTATATSVGLLILQDAVPLLMPSPTTFQPPRSRNSRLILAALVGLLAGVALSLVLERFDTRIRTKKAAERHFVLPVLAEIPFIPKRKRRRVAAVVPWRRFREDVPVILPFFPRVSDSFRLLGAGISRTALARRGGAGGPWTGGVGTRNGSGAVILVTSPGPAEGKTTVVANLAMTFAQVGKRVLVMSCDFRRPHIHELFGLDNTGGLVDALQSSDLEVPVLDGCIKQTPIRDVRLVPSGAHPRNTAALLSSDRMRTALDEARRQADIILIDTAPLLASAEVTHLFPLVDAVVVVARAKRTTAEIAERASELLKRLDAPVVGVALNGATEVPVPSSYYRYYTQPMGEPRGNGPRGDGRGPNGQGRTPVDVEEKPGRVGDSPL